MAVDPGEPLRLQELAGAAGGDAILGVGALPEEDQAAPDSWPARRAGPEACAARGLSRRATRDRTGRPIEIGEAIDRRMGCHRARGARRPAGGQERRRIELEHVDVVVGTEVVVLAVARLRRRAARRRSRASGSSCSRAPREGADRPSRAPSSCAGWRDRRHRSGRRHLPTRPRSGRRSRRPAGSRRATAGSARRARRSMVGEGRCVAGRRRCHQERRANPRRCAPAVASPVLAPVDRRSWRVGAVRRRDSTSSSSPHQTAARCSP